LAHLQTFEHPLGLLDILFGALVGSYCKTLRIGPPLATDLANSQPSGAVHCAVGFVVIKSIR